MIVSGIGTLLLTGMAIHFCRLPVPLPKHAFPVKPEFLPAVFVLSAAESLIPSENMVM